MLEHNETRRAAEWQVLHDRITKLLDQFGKKDPFGRGDYWLVDDDWGDYRQKLEVQTLSLLQPRVIKLLQAQLIGIEERKEDRAEKSLAGLPGTEHDKGDADPAPAIDHVEIERIER